MTPEERKAWEIDRAWEAHKSYDQYVPLSKAARELRDRLSESQNHRCCYCGIRTTEQGPHQVTLEHVTPRSLGGTNSLDNLVVACLKCNNERGSDPNWLPSRHMQKSTEQQHNNDDS